MIFEHYEREKREGDVIRTLSVIQGIIFSIIFIDVPFFVNEDLLNTPIAFVGNFIMFLGSGWLLYVPISLMLSDLFFKKNISLNKIN